MTSPNSNATDEMGCPSDLTVGAKSITEIVRKRFLECNPYVISTKLIRKQFCYVIHM